ncbi:hypothetical protein DPMN_000568 [Dreissena polymorpha]|uniref:Uncharacterized protein n=1 Tax=Dreissena polymorpha TaxID=45954 RepID=A0A9D4RQ19_DREPO|nr:hypothetical protein DPMN_000568 [Dreissena polymorpha]
MNLLTNHVFQAKVTISELIQDIIGTNLLSKFHEDRKINVASRVSTRKNAPPPGDHVFQPTGIIFDLVQDIIGINLLTKFHEDKTINVASRVKNAPPLGSNVFQENTNLLTKFHEDWTINEASGELTRQMLTPHDGQRTKSDHKSSHEHVVLNINGTNLLTKFHEDRKINVAPIEKCPAPGSHVFQPTGIIF